MTDTIIDTKFKLEGIDGAVATVRAFGNACEALPPGFEVSRVRLQDDEALVEKAALICAHVDAWSDKLHGDVHKKMYRRVAKEVLALVDDLQGQRLYKVTMPQSSDDAATLRAMFGEPDPGLGPQLRDFADETGAFDVLNDHYRKQRT